MPLNEKLFFLIRNAKRPIAEEAIQEADLNTLISAQEYGLTGDWRRAGVAKRIKQLQKQCPKP